MGNFISDEQMQQLESASPKPTPQLASAGFISDEDMSRLEKSDDPAFAMAHPTLDLLGGKKAINLLDKAGKAWDRGSGSRALRKGVGMALDSTDPMDQGPAGYLKNIGSGLSHWGEDIPAPSGKELVRKTEFGKGLSEGTAGALGMGAEMLLDPSMLIPTGAASRVAKTGVEGAGMVAKGGAKVAEGIGKGALAIGDILVPGSSKLVTVPLEKAAEVAGTLARYVRPEVQPEFVDAVKTAMEHGIDPELLPSSVKYGKESLINNLEKVRRQGITGEPHRKTFDEALGKVNEAFNRVTEKYAGGAKPLDPTAAGDLLKNRYNAAVKDFFDGSDISYDTFWKQNPGAQLAPEAKEAIVSKINGLRREAIRMVKRGATPDVKGQGQALMDILENAQDVVTNGNYKQSVELMRELGDVGFKRTRGVLPENAAAHRDLYAALSDGAIETAGRTDPGLAQDLMKRNGEFTDFFNTQRKLGLNLHDDTLSGEQLFKQAIENGDSTKIRALKEIFKNDPQAIDQLKASYLDHLLTLDKDGGLSFARLHTQLRNNEKTGRVMRELFSPEEADSITRLAKLGDDFGPPILNTSGTDRSGVLRNWFKSVPEAMSSDWMIDSMKSGAKVGPETTGGLEAIAPTLVAKPPAPGSPAMKFMGDIAADPSGAVKDYITRLKPTGRQALGKASQEYSAYQENQSRGPSPEALIEKVRGTKYEPALRAAAQRGQESFAATHFMLSQQDPEYQKAVGQSH